MSFENKGLHKQSDRNTKPQQGRWQEKKAEEHERDEEEQRKREREDGSEREGDKRRGNGRYRKKKQETIKESSLISPREWHLWKM